MNLDFQRLESVRARQRSQRKRWLSVLSILAGAAVVVALIQLAASVMPAWRDIVPLLSRGAALVETRGRVETIERETRTIHISSGFLGLTSVALVVTDQTLIVVGEKEGGFGDIHPGEPVVAAYEAGRGALQAKRVEVVLPGEAVGELRDVMEKSGRKDKRSAKRVSKDLPPREGRSVKAGVSNVLKTRHDTAKNSVGN